MKNCALRRVHYLLDSLWLLLFTVVVRIGSSRIESPVQCDRQQQVQDLLVISCSSLGRFSWKKIINLLFQWFVLDYYSLSKSHLFNSTYLHCWKIYNSLFVGNLPLTPDEIPDFKKQTFLCLNFFFRNSHFPKSA